jgi:flagellar protein FliL
MAAEQPTEEVAKKRSKKAVLIPVVVLVLALGGGAFFFLGGKSEAAAGEDTTTTTQLGTVVRLEPITLNLSDGHVLKVGMALQAVKEPQEEHLATALAGGQGAKPDATSPLGGEEAKALNVAIHTLGDMTFSELSAPGGREQAREKLREEIKHAYHDDIVDVYFTDFVMS